jgi:hypothetical protein
MELLVLDTRFALKKTPDKARLTFHQSPSPKAVKLEEYPCAERGLDLSLLSVSKKDCRAQVRPLICVAALIFVASPLTRFYPLSWVRGKVRQSKMGKLARTRLPNLIRSPSARRPIRKTNCSCFHLLFLG